MSGENSANALLVNNSIPENGEKVNGNDSRPVFTDKVGLEIVRDYSTEEKVQALNSRPINFKQKQILETAKQFGIKVVWSSSVSRGKYNPQTKTITLNPDIKLSSAYGAVFGHEFAHFLEAKKGYKDFSRYLFKQSSFFEEYLRLRFEEENGRKFEGSREQLVRAATESTLELYKSSKELTAEERKSFSVADAQMELVADFVGDVILGSQDFSVSEQVLNEMAKTNRSFIQRFIDFVKDLIVRLKGDKHNLTLEKDLQYLQERLQRVYDTANKKTTDTNGGEKFTIEKDANGDNVVVINTDQGIFVGLENNEYSKAAREYFNEKFKGAVLPLGTNGDIVSMSKKMPGEYAYPHTTLDNKSPEYTSKMKAITELHNLLKCAGKHTFSKDSKGNTEAKYGWDYYEVEFLCDGMQVSGLLNIANSDKGRVFYDITRIKVAPAISEKYVALLAKSNFTSRELSNNRISRNNPIVNNYSMPESKNNTSSGEKLSIRRESVLTAPQDYAKTLMRRNKSSQNTADLTEQISDMVDYINAGNYGAAMNRAIEAALGVIKTSRLAEIDGDDAFAILETASKAQIRLTYLIIPSFRNKVRNLCTI